MQRPIPEATYTRRGSRCRRCRGNRIVIVVVIVAVRIGGDDGED